MLFNSFPYILLFLPVVALGHYLVSRFGGKRWSQVWILAASGLFYGYGGPKQLILLAGSIVFNTLIARGLVSPNEQLRKSLLWVGLCTNIIFLFSFKYVGFFLHLIPGLSGLQADAFHWAAPLGMSFFTLTQVMYLVDTYQGLNQPNSLFDHATLVAFFPYISSGPLVRSRAIVPQLNGYKDPAVKGEPLSRSEMACRGVYLFAMGLAKKVILAEAFATVADAGFEAAARPSCLEAWIFCLAYSFQLYYDFSGYSDMAVGSALMLGINIPQNFNAPYRSKSISEFWQRWHISLSNFITNYLFTPMVRWRGKATLTTSVAATILAMGIAGLWHGPALTFVIFGLLHGVGLAVNQIWKKRKLSMPDWCGWLLTFLFLNVGFVFFRSPNVSSALVMLAAMAPHANLMGLGAFKKAGTFAFVLSVVALPAAAGVVLAFWYKTSMELASEFQANRMTVAVATALLLLCGVIMNCSTSKVFVYFAF